MTIEMVEMYRAGAILGVIVGAAAVAKLWGFVAFMQWMDRRNSQ